MTSNQDLELQRTAEEDVYQAGDFKATLTGKRWELTAGGETFTGRSRADINRKLAARGLELNWVGCGCSGYSLFLSVKGGK